MMHSKYRPHIVECSIKYKYLIRSRDPLTPARGMNNFGPGMQGREKPDLPDARRPRAPSPSSLHRAGTRTSLTARTSELRLLSGEKKYTAPASKIQFTSKFSRFSPAFLPISRCRTPGKCGYRVHLGVFSTAEVVEGDRLGGECSGLQKKPVTDR